ncbi:hypothetical protein EDB89DRAFT_1907314 [Lactarius sanguifluus]|nr:hypothetical protein EDB89DRAFT_1907314 [Lactarius sanguifluus]
MFAFLSWACLHLLTGLREWSFTVAHRVSPCMGNLLGIGSGTAGVRVWVTIFKPKANPYPYTGSRSVEFVGSQWPNGEQPNGEIAQRGTWPKGESCRLQDSGSLIIAFATASSHHLPTSWHASTQPAAPAAPTLNLSLIKRPGTQPDRTRDVNELLTNKSTRECDSHVTSTHAREYSCLDPRLRAAGLAFQIVSAVVAVAHRRPSSCGGVVVVVIWSLLPLSSSTTRRLLDSWSSWSPSKLAITEGVGSSASGADELLTPLATHMTTTPAGRPIVDGSTTTILRQQQGRQVERWHDNNDGPRRRRSTTATVHDGDGPRRRRSTTTRTTSHDDNGPQQQPPTMTTTHDDSGLRRQRPTTIQTTTTALAMTQQRYYATAAVGSDRAAGVVGFVASV